MEVLTRAELKYRYEEIVGKIKKGAVFIHPTDTIYGLGCNALDEKAVKKIRSLKEQSNKPFSVWVPSLAWVKKNCEVNRDVKTWLKKLPGPYTLIVKLKNKKAVVGNVNLKNKTIGIRQPDHWFGKVVEKAGVPLVTTSANRTGKPFMTTLKDLDKEIEKSAEFMIYECEKKARPSKIINLVEKTELER